MFTVYLSHPYTGDEDKNRLIARRIAARIVRKYPGIAVVNPLDALQYAKMAGLSYSEILEIDIELLSRCDAVLVRGDWERSRGCRREVQAAYERRIPVFWESLEPLLALVRDSGQEQKNAN